MYIKSSGYEYIYKTKRTCFLHFGRLKMLLINTYLHVHVNFSDNFKIYSNIFGFILNPSLWYS